ncbi:hypothetical protein LCGC14_2950680 [marine sediment metagenome]|uniref:Uncharacterized protein n=1 Tax=marine sediment metagenome TaxID=412755 RepID=A0A0F8XF25_9ZZZZ
MNEKKAEPAGLQNGVHPNTQGPLKEAPGASLGVQTGPAEANVRGKEQKEEPPKVREPYELQEEAWRLMDEAVSNGFMKLSNGVTITLNADSMIRVIQWLASAKAKKPHLINPPEDFRLKETTSEKD